ncbi:hypothetical protein VNO77_28772 [Canavalia gladiata]|uniref:60S acidic ribosomal protein P2 n=1 Tax=Canavalia gladiata TaxID=3824 RepID=A0AAN9QBC9_CANGL
MRQLLRFLLIRELVLVLQQCIRGIPWLKTQKMFKLAIEIQKTVMKSLNKNRNQANMKIVAAYCLAVLGGNLSPSANDLKHILGSVGVEAEEEMIKLLLDQCAGKDFNELIASGREQMAAVGSGGGAVAIAAAPGGGAAAGGAAPAAEAKEEKKEEEKEESDDDMGFSLFD